MVGEPAHGMGVHHDGDPGGAREAIGEVPGGGVSEVVRFDVVEHGPDARVVHVVGEIDTLTAPLLRENLAAQTPKAKLIVVDLSEVAFLGSAGLAALVATKHAADGEGHVLRLVPGTRIVHRALQATGLLEVFEVADDVPSALAAGTDDPV